MRDQTEEALRRHLGQVEAPPELWQRVHDQSGHRAATGREWLPLAAVAAALVLSVAGWSMWQASARPLEMHSASAAEVRQWVLANSGMDVPLPAKPASLVEILGASIDRAVATISYRVGALKATLSVSKASASNSSHKATDLSSTWTMNGQAYTLAVANPSDLRTACLLCHTAHEAALY